MCSRRSVSTTSRAPRSAARCNRRERSVSYACAKTKRSAHVDGRGATSGLTMDVITTDAESTEAVGAGASPHERSTGAGVARV